MSSASTTTAGRALIALALAGVVFAGFFLVGRAIGSDDTTATPQPQSTVGTDSPEAAKLALAPPVPNLIVPEPPKPDRRPANSAGSAPSAPVEVPVQEPAPAVAATPVAPATDVASPTAAPESAPQPDPAPQPEPPPTEPPVTFDDSG